MVSTFAALLPALILMCGFCIDLSVLRLTQMRMQTAADDAALSGAFEAEHGTWNWAGVGQQEASTYGFTNGMNNVTVTVAQGSDYGAYQGRTDTIEATIQQRVRSIFMGALTGGYVTVKAQSTALVTSCVYLTGSGKLSPYTYWSTTGAMNSYNVCPVSINQNMQVVAPSHVDVFAVDLAGPVSALTGGGPVVTAPNYNLATITDPLTKIVSPSFNGSCDHTGYTLTGQTATLNPGNYCNGITLTNSTVTLNPGLYVITGGAAWNNSTVTGNGVTLFFTQGGGAGYGQFLMNFSTVALTAPSSSSNGAIAAIAVFLDRNWTATAAQDVHLYFTTMQADGIWYMPKAGLFLWNAGTVTGPHYLGVVADNLFTEGTDFNPRGDYSFVSTGNPFRLQNALVQ
jgi:Flp pilus assembly protein TadG